MGAAAWISCVLYEVRRDEGRLPVLSEGRRVMPKSKPKKRVRRHILAKGWLAWEEEDGLAIRPCFQSYAEGKGGLYTIQIGLYDKRVTAGMCRLRIVLEEF